MATGYQIALFLLTLGLGLMMIGLVQLRRESRARGAELAAFLRSGNAAGTARTVRPVNPARQPSRSASACGRVALAPRDRGVGKGSEPADTPLSDAVAALKRAYGKPEIPLVSCG